jgi:hypothetical protein
MRALLLVVLLLTGCATTPPPKPIDQRSDVIDRYITCYNLGDIGCLRALFSPNIQSMDSSDADTLLDAHAGVIDAGVHFTAEPLIVEDGYALSTLNWGNNSGWLFMTHEAGQIDQLYWGKHLPDMRAVSVATTGQVADTASTALALSNGAFEANPIMSGALDTGGFPLMLAIKLGTVAWAKNQVYPQCMDALRSSGTLGWGAAASNVVMFAAGPVGLVAGVATMGLMADRAEASAEATCLKETIARL